MWPAVARAASARAGLAARSAHLPTSAAVAVASRRTLIDLKKDTVRELPTESGSGEARKNDRLMPLAEYFALRSKISTQSLGAGAVVGVASFFGTSQAVAFFAGDLLGDPYANPPVVPEPIWDMDPLVVFSMGVVASSATFFGLSRVVYRKIWELTHKDEALRLEQRQRDIFERVEKFRCVGEEHGDDYYGESIKSAPTYLVWLRKQKKRQEELRELGVSKVDEL